MSQNLSQQHIEQSEHNKDFLQEIIANFPDYTDWIITVTFYFALHRVQARLLKDFNLDPDRHEHRNPMRSRNKLVQLLLPNYWEDYHTLYHESRKARYHPNYHKRINITDIRDLILDALKLFENVR